jgi:hypothetical protein
MLWVVVPTQGSILDPDREIEALDLARRLAPPDRVLPVFTTPPGKRAPYFDGERILQPYHRGSAAEVLLALHRIERVDPDAVVVVLPADTVGRFDVAIEAAVERAIASDRCTVVAGTRVVVAPLRRLMMVFREEASWLVSVLRDFFNATSPLLPRTLEELFRILPRRELEDLLVRTRQPILTLVV